MALLKTNIMLCGSGMTDMQSDWIKTFLFILVYLLLRSPLCSLFMLTQLPVFYPFIFQHPLQYNKMKQAILSR